jgi:hypothetical protein
LQRGQAIAAAMLTLTSAENARISRAGDGNTPEHRGDQCDLSPSQ